MLTGHDNDLHQSTQFNAQTLASLTLVRNSSLPVLTFDSGSQLTTGLTALSIPLFNVNPDTAAAVTASLFDITRFSAFAVASYSSFGGCDNSSAGLANIAAQSTAIASYFNAGGGIDDLTGGRDLAAYAYVPESASNAGGSQTANNHFQTADGATLGIPAVNGDATHNVFPTPGTGGVSPLFRVVETQGTGAGAIPLTNTLVGGTIVCMPTSTAAGCTIVGGTPPTTSVPEPASLAVLAVGMLGLGALHRRRRLTPRAVSATPPRIPAPRRRCAAATQAGAAPLWLPRYEENAVRDKGEYLFTSESVSEGHPDKVADRISDTVLDAFLAADPYARVACETMVTTNRIVLAGETRGPETVTPELLGHLARLAVHDIGYDQAGFSWRHAKVECHLHSQSADIAVGVDSAGNKDEGAGDQGIMFGYACTETSELMPAPLFYAHLILRRISELRKNDDIAVRGLQPDAKSQVTLRYVDGRPVGATSIVVSTQHDDGMSQDDIKSKLMPLIETSLPAGWMPGERDIYVNPTGKFVIGGPDGDCGLTGRKIIVDTYGGAAPHGGGAFSGKDPTKVDRSAAYACRYLAKNVVAAGLASRCTLQISYAIGVSHPLSVYVDLHGTGADVDEAKLERVLRELMNLSPRGIREHLRLNRPIYAVTSAYGHFGRTPDEDLGTFTWERTDLAPALRTAFGR